MTVIQYKKVKCDECGKIVEMKEHSDIPIGWYTIEIVQWFGHRGENKFSKELCSKKCIKKTMDKFKRLPNKKPIYRF